MIKKIRAIIEIEIDDANEFRKAWKSECYDNEIEFLNDYFSPDSFNEDMIDFDFEIKRIKFQQLKGEGK